MTRLKKTASQKTAAHRPLEALEKRDLLAAQAGKVKVYYVGNLQDQTKDNATRIVVAFTEPVVVADATKIAARGYAINLPANGQRKLNVPIKAGSARVVPGSNGTEVEFTTERIVRKGGQFYFYPGAINDASSGTNVVNVPGNKPLFFSKGLNKERFTLANRQFVPTDFSIFADERYDAAPVPAVADDEPSATSVRAALYTFLSKKVDTGVITAAQRSTAFEYFDDEDNGNVAPSANLRAAICSLVGTIAEPALESFFGNSNQTKKPYAIITSSNELFGQDALVAETSTNSNNKLRCVLNPRYIGESFVSLSAVMAHEVIHQDDADPQNEEVVANTVEAVVWAQQVDVDQSFLRSGTELVAKQNARLLALINSGDYLFPRIGVTNGPSRDESLGVIPGGNNIWGGTAPVNSFVDEVTREYRTRNFPLGDSNMNTPAARVLGNMFGTAELDINTNLYSDELVSRIDAEQGAMSDKLVIRLAKYMKLSF